uniref:FAD-dependent oxidoreductase n=1 Tax=Neorhizobium sp. EC2-8 TaxID=3129230 RepID=UPI0031012CCC
MRRREGPDLSISGEGFADIPPGALRAADLGNLYLAGRVAGADAVAYGSSRVMGTAFATGQAAGVMAAINAEPISYIDPVRKELASQNALI